MPPQVEFETEQRFQTSRIPSAAADPTFVRLLLKTGIVKDRKQAEYVLLGAAALFFIISFVVFKNTFFNSPAPQQMPPGFVPGNMPSNMPGNAPAGRP